MKWQAKAPANIALIKYMGKSDAAKNIPSNASISYTLNHLLTYVELEPTTKDDDHWEPLTLKEKNYPIKLSDKGIARFLAHLQKIKNCFNYQGNFIVRSANNFPSDCGLASSASSYAALTMVACQAIAKLAEKPILDTNIQAQLSQQGSGSSCRSFYSPWCTWEGTEVKPADLPYKNLHHQVIVVDKGKKTPTSSQAHLLIPTSLLNNGRAQRAEQRYQLLMQALQQQDWQQAYVICWQEFWDMHALFETANPPFNYMKAASLSVLNTVRQFWQQEKDGPLVTMDAGPNIHLLYRQQQVDIAKHFAEKFSQQFTVIASD